MSKISPSLLSLIGDTPLVEIKNIDTGLCKLYVKMESHNHPIAVDPRQGAVGVGNVNRDLITMGAEPVGQLNILRFGNPKEKHIRDIVNAVVPALGSYSNNFGGSCCEIIYNRRSIALMQHRGIA